MPSLMLFYRVAAEEGRSKGCFPPVVKPHSTRCRDTRHQHPQHCCYLKHWVNELSCPPRFACLLPVPGAEGWTPRACVSPASHLYSVLRLRVWSAGKKSPRFDFTHTRIMEKGSSVTSVLRGGCLQSMAKVLPGISGCPKGWRWISWCHCHKDRVLQ